MRTATSVNITFLTLSFFLLQYIHVYKTFLYKKFDNQTIIIYMIDEIHSRKNINMVEESFLRVFLPYHSLMLLK